MLYICVVYIHIPLLMLNLEETGNLLDVSSNLTKTAERGIPLGLIKVSM